MRHLLAFCLMVAGGGLAAQSPHEGVPTYLDPSACSDPAEGWSERALARMLAPPLGLPPLIHPEENPPTQAGIELGRKLFFDRRLSINKTMSCAMCHVPEQAFVSWELRTAVGVEGRGVKRNAPTILNVGYLSPLFHDGRDEALETQFVGPMVARNEMANPSVGRVIAQLRGLPDYGPLFDAAFGAQPSLDRVGKALASYQRSVLAANSPFDRWYYGGEEDALSEAQRRGFDLFSEACATCHEIGETGALFTDQAFHNTGYGVMREEMRQSPPDTARIEVAPGVVHEVDFAIVAAVGKGREADLGRYEVTEDPADRWKFRTPGLRNVAVTPPYMHDGGFGTLREVLDFYNQGGAGVVGQDPRVRPLDLSDKDLADLESFLETLTSPDLPCLAAEARMHPPDNH